MSEPGNGAPVPASDVTERIVRPTAADGQAPPESGATRRTLADALNAAAQCPYALGASIFGPEPLARSLAGRVRAGSVIINDLIVPTADPRLPFGGQGISGFGTTRGAEGLMEMTVLKTVTLRSGRFRPHYDPVTPADTAMMLDYI